MPFDSRDEIIQEINDIKNNVDKSPLKRRIHHISREACQDRKFMINNILQHKMGGGQFFTMDGHNLNGKIIEMPISRNSMGKRSNSVSVSAKAKNSLSGEQYDILTYEKD